MNNQHNDNDIQTLIKPPPKNNDNNKRRSLLVQSLSFITTVTLGVTSSTSPSNAVERAVGSSELSCRTEGNCLEKGEWDGAVGWNWGGKDRCDA